MFEETDFNLELNQELEKKVINHRKKFALLFRNRYLELLSTLIHYKNEGSVSIDFLKVEIALNSGFDIVIGANNNEKIVVLGFATSTRTTGNPTILFETQTLSKDDITFLIPPSEIPIDMKEINYNDGCETGNFVVIRNKTHNYQSDSSIINYYVSELAEIVLSRFSLTMQAKITTFFTDSKANDETINELIKKLYNGAPYVKVGKGFDPIEQIITVQGAGNVPSNLEAMKKEYQNKISELNNMLGINSLAVDKESGVSDSEANSNRGFTTSNANIKLTARNHALKKLNKRYGLKLEAVYNDEVESQEGEKIDNDTNDDNQKRTGE